jgi:hypothetical protein
LMLLRQPVINPAWISLISQLPFAARTHTAVCHGFVTVDAPRVGCRHFIWHQDPRSQPWWHQPILTATYIEVLTLSLCFIFVCCATRDIFGFIGNCPVNCAGPIMQSLYGD